MIRPPPGTLWDLARPTPEDEEGGLSRVDEESLDLAPPKVRLKLEKDDECEAPPSAFEDELGAAEVEIPSVEPAPFVGGGALGRASAGLLMSGTNP